MLTPALLFGWIPVAGCGSEGTSAGSAAQAPETSAPLASPAGSAQAPAAAGTEDGPDDAHDWRLATFKDDPAGVTRGARRFVPDISGGLTVLWFVSPDGVDPKAHVNTVLKHVQPQVEKGDAKLLLLQTDNQGLVGANMGWLFVKRESGWQQDATPEERALVMRVMGQHKLF